MEYVGERNIQLISEMEKRYKIMQMENCAEMTNGDDIELRKVEFVDCGSSMEGSFNLQAVKLEPEDSNVEADSDESLKGENTEFVGERISDTIWRRVETDVMIPETKKDDPSHCDEFFKEELDIEMNVDVDKLYDSIKREDTDSCNIGNNRDNEEKHSLGYLQMLNKEREQSTVQTSGIFMQKRILHSGCIETSPTSCSSCGKSLENKSSGTDVNIVRHVIEDAKDITVQTKEKYSCGQETLNHCPECTISLTQASSITKYRHTHNEDNEGPFHFETSNSLFVHQPDLNRHQLIHIREKPFSCNNCNKSFTRKWHLLSHMLTHTGERPFSCNKCNKSFTQKQSLKCHMRTHSGEKPFSCNICIKSFTQNSSLLKHMLTHTGEKPFSCNNCNKSFTHSSSLKSHMLFHTGEKPFSCNSCNKSFTHRSSLKSHMLFHTGEKPFSCNNCNKSFTQRLSLKSHILTHTGERPFICTICNKSFTRKRALTIHMLTHSGEL